MNFPKDQLFCLLGPNGAGKTTTINCLTGITPVTGGDGNVFCTSLFSFPFWYMVIYSLNLYDEVRRNVIAS